MKIKTKQITVTAIMLAICLVSQFFKNLSVYITGPVINAALILTVLYAGMACGIILSIITPVTSFFITGSPVMAAIPAMFPCIMIGNIILVACVGLLRKKCGKAAGFPVSIAIGAILKALFMGIAIALIILPAFLPAPMHKMLPVLQLQFSVTQLIRLLNQRKSYRESWCTNHPWQKYQRIAAYPKTIYYTHLMQSRHRFPSLILYILTVVIHFM